MGNGYFAVLVAALFFVGYLVFNLNTAGTGFNHFFRQQVGGFRIAETGIDVGDNRYDVGLEVVDLALDFGSFGIVACGTGFVQSGKQQIEFAGIRLFQEGVQLFNQCGHRGFFVHGLVGQRAELGTHTGNHPAGKVEVAFVRGLMVFFHRNQFLLSDKTVPAAQRLGVVGRIGIVFGHVAAHDGGGVFGNVQAGFEAVLQTHTGNVFRGDGCPTLTVRLFDLFRCFDFFLIISHCDAPYILFNLVLIKTPQRFCNGV